MALFKYIFLTKSYLKNTIKKVCFNAKQILKESLLLLSVSELYNNNDRYYNPECMLYLDAHSLIGKTPEKLNQVSKKYKGTYFWDIIPWIKKGLLSGIILEKEILNFIKKIDNFAGIGIDMYMY